MSRHDIAYDLNQCAKFLHYKKPIHATTIKRILQYLKSTQTKDILVSPFNKFWGDCYAGTDFEFLWKEEDEQDHVSVSPPMIF